MVMQCPPRKVAQKQSKRKASKTKGLEAAAANEEFLEFLNNGRLGDDPTNYKECERDCLASNKWELQF